jgi:rhodanese-related sulfurtransferase
MRNPISKKELCELANKKITVRLIDIRSTDEYKNKHVPDAINIPAEELQNNIDCFSKDDVIVCICNHGKERSQKAAEQLYNSGFINTHYLTGGIGGWYEESYTPDIQIHTHHLIL